MDSAHKVKKIIVTGVTGSVGKSSITNLGTRKALVTLVYFCYNSQRTRALLFTRTILADIKEETLLLNSGLFCRLESVQLSPGAG